MSRTNPVLPGRSLARPAAAAPGGGAIPSALSIGEAWAIVRRHTLLISISFVACVALGIVSFLLFIKFLPLYTVEGYFSVDSAVIPNPVDPRAARGIDHELINQFAQTQAILVKSPGIIQNALDRSEIRETRWFNKDISTAMIRLMDDLKSYAVRETNYVRVALTGTERRELHLVVNSVLESYLNHMATTMDNNLRRQIENMDSERRKVNNDIRNLRERMEIFKTQNNLTTLAEKRTTVGDDMMTFNQMAIEAFMVMTAAEGIHKSLQDGFNSGQLEPTVEIRAFVNNHPRIQNLEQRHMLLEEERAQRMKIYNIKHRRVKELDWRIATIDRMLETERQRMMQQETLQMLERARTQSAGAAERYTGLEEKREEARAMVADLDRRLNEYMVMETDMEKLQEDFARVDTVIKTKEIQSRMPEVVRVSIAQYAAEPLERSFPRIEYYIPVAIILSLLIAVAMAFLVEFMDTSVRRPLDVARHVQMPMLGFVPSGADTGLDQADLGLIVEQQPQSVIAESFRQIRTSLLFSAPGEELRSLAVTSPSSGDGKTCIAANLAVSLAQYGRKVLLIDANFRRPGVGGLFQDAKQVGLSNLLTGQAALDEVVGASGIDGLDVMSTGPVPPNPAELLGSSTITEILAVAAEKYDHVIFDGPPALVVSDAAVLATRVQGVICVVRAGRNSRGVATRMRNELQKVNAQIIGVVLNAVRTTGGGYFRKSYRTYYAYQAADSEVAHLPPSDEQKEEGAKTS